MKKRVRKPRRLWIAGDFAECDELDNGRRLMYFWQNLDGIGAKEIIRLIAWLKRAEKWIKDGIAKE